MNCFVVDASVAIKWFIPEVHSSFAARLQAPGNELHVPSFFDVEMGNILWKKLQRSELTRPDADGILTTLAALPLRRHPDGILVPAAVNLAAQTGRTVYDCMYLALAIQLGGRMVTADERFRNALAASPLAVHLCWIELLP